MIEPVAIQNIALSALCAGAVVFFGAAYSIFLALGNLNNNRPLQLAAYGAYGLLAISVLALTVLLNLSQWWILLTATLLIGYYAVPRIIWRLSVDLHEDTEETQDISTKNKVVINERR